MNYIVSLITLTLLLAGCGGGGGGDSETNAPPETPDTTNPEPEVVSGFTLEQRRAHKELINAEYAENRSITGSGVGIAVFDRGINIDHNEFGGRTINPNSRKVESGFNRLTKEEHQFTAENQYRTFDDGEQFDENGHGTAVSTLIIGEAGGVAPDVDLLMIDITRTSVFVDGAVIIGMLDEIADDGFSFMSASFGGTDSYYDPSQTNHGVTDQDQTPFWRKLATRDIGLINGAGNDGEDLTAKKNNDAKFDDGGGQVLVVDDPLIAQQFVYVGAASFDGQLWDGSNTPGENANIQDRFIVAPGEDVVTALHDDDTALGRWSGTSFATPMVSSAAALVKSQNPALTNRAVLEVLLESANRSFDGYEPELHGRGILDIEAALEYDTTGLERVGD